jgi:hypothetical protein
LLAAFCLHIPIYEVRKRDIICVVKDPFRDKFTNSCMKLIVLFLVLPGFASCTMLGELTYKHKSEAQITQMTPSAKDLFQNAVFV